MSVLRNDLQEMRALYQIKDHDGLWKVYAYQDQPMVTMVNIESGSLVEMPLIGPMNANTHFMRYIDEHDCVMDAAIPDSAPTVDVSEFKHQQPSDVSNEDLKAILVDLMELTGELIDGGKLTKELKAKFLSVYEVASPLVDGEDQE